MQITNSRAVLTYAGGLLTSGQTGDTFWDTEEMRLMCLYPIRIAALNSQNYLQDS